MFKNSIKLLCANFDKVWKFLVYLILSWGIVLALLAPFYSTFAEIITQVWVENNLGSVFTSGTFYGLSVTVAEALTSVLGAIFAFIKILFTTNVWIGIYFAIIVYVVRSILHDVGKFVTCEMMYGYMATSTKVGFTSTLLRTLKKSLSYAGIKLLFALPFNVLICLGIYGLSLMPGNAVLSVLLPILIIIIPSLLLAFKQTFISGWAAAMIVFDCNVFKAFAKGEAAVLRRGLRVYSTVFIIFIMVFLLAMAFGLYSLVIILPVLFPLIYTFEMVMFFSSQGMRFYVDTDTILTPKRLEEVDKIENAKYLL